MTITDSWPSMSEAERDAAILHLLNMAVPEDRELIVGFHKDWRTTGMILGAMRERGWNVTIRTGRENTVWFVNFLKGVPTPLATDALTLPEAVAHAALKALEGESND